MNEKSNYIEDFKKRTKKIGIDVILFCHSLKKCSASSAVTYQRVKSETSAVATNRAACRECSKTEFFSKICIAVKEADKSVFWLEVIDDANLSSNKTELDKLLNKEIQILKMVQNLKILHIKNFIL